MGARPHPNAERTAAPDPDPDLAAAALDADPDPRPTPPRGFDAVAEAVLGDEPAAPAGSPLADPMERINDAVRAGRIDTAARLADETLEHAARTLGAEHPEVLRLRELTAYIAYLGGEPVRAFRLSLDLAPSPAAARATRRPPTATSAARPRRGGVCGTPCQGWNWAVS